ncbi:uncharacterized protein EAE98_010636 [Botrytis deweyae]|uniref:Uncharacterized protein n=1 Tax=Botrytis deweyae TaxID=2478750 RepID=A0ABQ7I894_9HELO|nr:uncharacterized protein EAE98_010636 [Botrytis deweyae]KAF7916627.1 hypothetical protein EAE98_010636 [Botrytis deweyae]
MEKRQSNQQGSFVGHKEQQTSRSSPRGSSKICSKICGNYCGSNPEYTLQPYRVSTLLDSSFSIAFWQIFHFSLSTTPSGLEV